MSKSSRRDFLLTSSTAVAGALLSPNVLMADTVSVKTADIFSQSGLITGQKKPLGYQSITGFLSAEQIQVHFDGHYGGALKGYVAADKQLQAGIVKGEAISSAAYGALQRARTTKSNSVILHELYFAGMRAVPSAIDSLLKKTIDARFGSVEKWAADFKACAKASSGWAVLAFHPVNGKLYNMISDAHATGVSWMATPLIVIDVYEHAYYIDFKNKKSDYIDAFLTYVDYHAASQRLQLG